MELDHKKVYLFHQNNSGHYDDNDMLLFFQGFSDFPLC